jgi:predicted transcriptional regulator
MLSTRLSPDVEARLNSFTAAYGLTKSAVAEAAISDYMARIQHSAKDKLLDVQKKGKTLSASDRVLQSLKELSKKMPNQDFDWKAARDEGRR